MARGPERRSERVERQLRELGAARWRSAPSVRKLAADYQTSSETIRRALGVLAAEGMVTIVPRWGTFVAEQLPTE